MTEKAIAILGNDKRVYEAEDFLAASKTRKDAIGIIVRNSLIGERVLAFDSWIEEWGEEETIVENRNESAAVQITCGLEDTKRIVEVQKDPDDMTAAKRCWEYRCGDLQWYLPSLLELAAIYNHRDDINSLMEKLGCDDKCLLPTLNSDETWVWSSSENSSNNAWGVHFINGNFYSINKSSTYVVRAVAAFSSARPFSDEPKSQVPNQSAEMTDEEVITMLRNRGYKGQITKTLDI